MFPSPEEGLPWNITVNVSKAEGYIDKALALLKEVVIIIYSKDIEELVLLYHSLIRNT